MAPESGRQRRHFDLDACRARVATLRAQRPAAAFPCFPANKMIDPLPFADSLSFRLKTGSDGSWEASFFST